MFSTVLLAIIFGSSVFHFISFSLHVVIVTGVLLQILKFTLTCCTGHSLHYAQIIHIATIKIIAVDIHCNISFFVS